MLIGWYYFFKNVRGRMESALTIKGQATIPKAVREHLHLKPGDRVKFFVHPDGSVMILPKLPTATLRGIISSRLGWPATLDEMDLAVAAGASAGVRRGKLR